jgi:phage regulator Rha-like protein
MKKSQKERTASLIPTESVITKILGIRNQKVILDSELAKLYGVPTKRLNEAVKRNKKRFPPDFMFQLNQKEFEALRSQFATSKGRGGRRYIPLVFTEQGVAMLSSVLNSERAIEVNIMIMRAFVKLREIISTHKKVEEKLKELEQKLQSHDDQIVQIIQVIHQLITPPELPKRKIGFTVEEYRKRL